MVGARTICKISVETTGAFTVWDSRDGTNIHNIQRDVSVTGVYLNADESRVMVAYNGGQIEMLSMQTGEVLFSFGHDAFVHDAQWSVDERRIFTWSLDGAFRVWDAESGNRVFTLSHDESDVFGATWTQDESLLITQSGEDLFCDGHCRTESFCFGICKKVQVTITSCMMVKLKECCGARMKRSLSHGQMNG